MSVDFSFQRHESTRVRSGLLKLGDLNLETPILWLGQQIYGVPEPWTQFAGISGIMVNASEVLSYARPQQGIHEFLSCPGIPVMMDSGGFLFLKKKCLTVTPDDILELYRSSKPDIGVILDHPLDPEETTKVNNRRWQKTLENTRRMIEGNSGELALMPVVHGHTLDEVREACEAVKAVMETRLIGIGSLVPLIKGNSTSKKFGDPNRSKTATTGRTSGMASRQFLIEAVKLVREEFPDAFLHVFGIGSVTTMHLMFSLGVDSIDSISWRLKAAFGMIQLPGVPDRYPRPKKSTNKTRAVLSASEGQILIQCKCPVCVELSLEERIEVLDNSFRKRAIHNAWTFVQEGMTFREYAKQSHNSLEQFVEDRLQRSPMRVFLDQAFGS